MWRFCRWAFQEVRSVDEDKKKTRERVTSNIKARACCSTHERSKRKAFFLRLLSIPLFRPVPVALTTSFTSWEGGWHFLFFSPTALHCPPAWQPSARSPYLRVCFCFILFVHLFGGFLLFFFVLSFFLDLHISETTCNLSSLLSSPSRLNHAHGLSNSLRLSVSPAPRPPLSPLYPSIVPSLFSFFLLQKKKKNWLKNVVIVFQITKANS